MRFFRFVVCAAALGVVACDDAGTEVILAPDEPLAHTRFVNVVPDTGGQDWRFVDDIENSPEGLNLLFRGFTPYRGTTPGTRPLRVFPTSTDIDVTSSRLIDTTLTFEAGQYYTIVHVGLARPGGAVENRVILIQDDHPEVDAGSFALRAMHLGTGWGNIDVYGAPSTSGTFPGTSIFSNVAFLSTTPYDMIDVGDLALRALPTGETARTSIMANTVAQEGDEGSEEDNLEPIGGTNVPGSAILAIFTPGSVVGSSAPQGSAFVVSTTDETLFATTAGFHRSTGSFISSNFFVGQEIEADGWTSNDGTYTVTAVEDFARTGTIELERTATGYVRTEGSFIDDGFVAPMEIYVTGFDSTANNGPQTVAAVTATELTIAGASVNLEEPGDRSICANPCSTLSVDGPTVAEAASDGDRRIRGPRPAWVYIIDKHPR